MKKLLALMLLCFLPPAGILADSAPVETAMSEDLVQIMEKAAQGDAEAQYELGQTYDDGFDLPQDHQEALKWYTKSAEQGNAEAQYCLGGIYYWGQGAAKDYQKAYKWFKKAAEQGDPYAQFNLGVMYRKGRGTDNNYIEAYKWFSLAANHNDEDAQQNLSSLEQEMTPEQLQQARKAIEDWRKAHP